MEIVQNLNMDKFTSKIESSNSDDSGEELPEVDNKYSSSQPSDEEEKEDLEKHQQLTGLDIGEKVKKQSNPAPKKSYRGNFSTLKPTDDEPYGCPYGACGRKFVSAGQLKEHVER